MSYYRYPLITFFLLGYIFSCTIGVGRDVDGSAVLWKNRDVPFDSDQLTDIQYEQSDSIFYLQIVSSSSSSPYIGFNEAGFGIANSVVQIDDDINCSDHQQQTENRSLITDEYLLIREALSTCSDIQCFYSLVINLESTEPNIAFCNGLDIDSCTDSDNKCYWSDSDACGNGCFANHIQSNFAVIDNSGEGAIFEVRTFISEGEDIFYREDLGSDYYDALYRSNHFKHFENRQDISTPPADDQYDYLNSYNCDNLEDHEMRGNARRWCSSEEYFDYSNSSSWDNSIIWYLIRANGIVNDNRGPFLRSVSRSNPNNDGDIFFDLAPLASFYEQAVYDCGEGRPSGYIWTHNSVARSKTTSSTVIKSMVGNTDQSFALVTLGNPLINPYFPIKISDFSNINGINFNPYTTNGKILSDYIFDYGRDPDPSIKRWVDSQHLMPYGVWFGNGTFFYLENSIEYQYIDLSNGTVLSGTLDNNLSDAIGTIDLFYNHFLDGFETGGYDNPEYKIAYRKKDSSGCANGIAPLYYAERIIDRTFHRDHSAGLKWVIEDPSDTTNFFDIINPQNIINPIFTASDWSYITTNIGDTVNIKMYDLSDSLLLTASNKKLGCTNNDYLNYDNQADIDNNTCADIIQWGCTDEAACNYDSEANSNDDSCIYIADGECDCEGNVEDCASDCDGEAFSDDCEVCSGGNSGHEANSDKDCNGDCFGEAFLDDCETCAEGNSGHVANSEKDCNGDCFGEAFLDDCEQCVDGNTGSEQNWAQDCNGNCFGEAVEDCNGNCGYSDLCGDLNGDSILNVLDITLLIGMILDSTSEIDYSLSDMNNDGIVNIQDVVILIYIILDS